MSQAVEIGGASAVTLTDAEAPSGFAHATVLPGRGMTLLQARVRHPRLGEFDALTAPPLEEAARLLDGGPEDFAGNKAFSLGGAILLPYANRITGQDVPGAREIEAQVAGRPARLPRNWGGKDPGARQYAMHGLILDARAAQVSQPTQAQVEAHLQAGDFGGRWPGRADVRVRYALAGGALELTVETVNVGHGPLPLGVGWHPYFNLPSGRRDQAVLRLPAGARAPADNYDEVLPTGEIAPVAGTAFDFRQGRALDGLYLDDCFTDLARDDAGQVVCEVLDPAAGYGLRISTATPQVKALQVYAPPDKAFVVVEPQFNLADPYSSVWAPGVDTGMALLAPGERVVYQVRLETFEV
ncbi:aldose 1-epimerase [Phenylobacterium sp.]|jgi:galactose mutarotase-like enzyme|uniref:aldose 1-epimerase n=1 Tax=Phenylobacterium sp. TaxID=1871053 RepID=UPI002E37128F|nr:aldose 1-epimerase [Phenylobacterium sp.]HEX2561890.1 aldose 1-epimerase [Phenylobacterium sp.]